MSKQPTPQQEFDYYQKLEHPFNPEMLYIMRDVRGHNTASLAIASGLSAGDLTRMLGGILEPDFEQITKLCHALQTPVGFFYRVGRRVPPQGWQLYCKREGRGKR